ncbi:MAG TPA: thioredoxin family protein [Propionibacteriaceae bacterium]|nr:thioredoxin family protein [Propionibacteriaceae bacterium]
MDIKILGMGCPKCKRLEQITREVTTEMGIDATFTKVTDIDDIMAYEIAATPGLVVDGQVLSYGRLPSKAEIESLLSGALG